MSDHWSHFSEIPQKKEQKTQSRLLILMKQVLFKGTALHSGSSRSGRSGGSNGTVRWSLTTAHISWAAQQVFKRCLADNTFVQARGALFLHFSLFPFAPCHPNLACRGYSVLQSGLWCGHALTSSYSPITCTKKGVQHLYTLLQPPSTKVCRNM